MSDPFADVTLEMDAKTAPPWFYAAIWRDISTWCGKRGDRVILFDGKVRVGTRIEGGEWEADEGGLITPSDWLAYRELPPK